MVASGVGGPDENKKFIRISKACRVSSVVEQRFCKPLVGSSNLSPGTNKSKSHAGFSATNLSRNRGATGALRINSSDRVAANKTYSPRFLPSMIPTVIKQ